MNLIFKLKKSAKLKRIIFYLVVIFTGVYVFSVASFGGNSSILLRLSVYASMVVLGVLSISYSYLYLNLKLHKACILIPAFVIYALFGTLIYSKEYREWLSLVLLAGSFFVFLYAFKVINNKRIIVSIISISFFLFSIYFIFYFRKEILSLSFLKNGSVRLGHPFDNPNGVAAFAIVGVSAPLYLLLFTNKKIRFLFVAPLLSSVLVGLATGSRTFLILLIVFILVFLFFKFKKHKVIYLIAIIITAVILIVLINLPFMSDIKERFLRAIGTIFGTGYKVDTATLERVIWTDYGFYLGFKKLLFGYGASGFGIVSGIETYSHSNFAETLCDFGLVGFVLFYTPLVILLCTALFSKKIDKVFVVSFVIYYLIASFSNVIYYKKIYYLILALLYYLVFFENVQKKTVPIIKQIKNIVFTCDSMGAGGAEKVIASLSNEMTKRDINVSIIGVADIKKAESFYRLNSAKYIALLQNKKKKTSHIKRVVLLRKIINNLSPDIVISFLPNANIYTWLALIGTNIPYIVSERNNPFIDPKRRIERLLKTISFNASCGAVFQTNDAMNYYSKRVVAKGIIIKNPIILNSYPESNCENRNNVVLAVGRLTEQKNYRCLLDAFKLFNSSTSKSYLLKIYGDGPLKNDLLNYCKEIEIEKDVVFVGNDSLWHKKEFNDAMYVLSSNYEGMPNALAEAMALGIPCISTDCPTGGSRELISDGINGYLVPINDPVALCDKMKVVSRLDSKTLYNETRNLIQKYSIENITTEWLDFVKSFKKDLYE